MKLSLSPLLYAAASVGVVSAQSQTQGAGAQCLYNSHFVNGTYIIDQPGASYKLCDNIIFCPNGGLDFDSASDEEIAKAFDPQAQGNPKYNNNQYALGFFAAVAVEAEDVSFSLNGYSIGQCKEHALMQRFFAVFELANAPFTPMVGPHDFIGSGTFKAAKNFKIMGPGTIGLSSHHGIHGNENENILITGVTFKDFEVGAVSLNNVKGLQIKNCNIPNNRQDVPVLGSFSAALKIRPYLEKLKALSPGFSMPFAGEPRTVEQVHDALVTSIANVLRDIRAQGEIIANLHPQEWMLYNNFHRVVDGPCYAFLVHGAGPAVGGIGETMSEDINNLSQDVTMLKNNIQNIKCFTNEVLAAVVNGRVQNDARGAVLQFYNAEDETYIGVHPDGSYHGNVNLDAQIMVGEAMRTGALPPSDPILQNNVNSIDLDLIRWAEGEDPTFTISDKFRCNGDSMHHVIKGSIMIRVEDTMGFDIQGNSIEHVEILSKGPVELCADFHLGAAVVDGSARLLADVRGISVAAVSAYDPLLASSGDSFISHNTITDFKSQSANFINGIDINGFSEGVNIENNYVNLDTAVGNDPNDKWVGLRIRQAASGIFIKQNNNFVQGELIESRRRLPEYHPRPAGNEWPNNGCPFNH